MKFFVKENASENIVYEMAAIFSRGRWVKYNNAAVKLEHILDIKGNKDTPYLTLNCELWGVYYENF